MPGVVWVLMVKEFLQALRDKRMLMVIFIMPLIQVTVFGYAISNDVKNITLTVADQDGSRLSREVASALVRGGYFILHRRTNDPREARKDLLLNRARIALVIPPDFARRMERGDAAPLQLLVDGSDGSSAGIALGYALRILQKSLSPPARLPAAFRPPRVELEERVWYNPEVESRYYLLPGIVTMVLTVVIMLLTAMAITRERESGSLEQLLVSPIRSYELLLGKTLPFAAIGLFDAALVTAAGIFIFGLPLRGSLPALFVLQVIYIAAMLGLGLLISTVSGSQQQAMLTVFAFLFPALILSDFFFPLGNMPESVQVLMRFLNPLLYGLRAQREIFLKGAGLAQVRHDLLALLAFAAVFFSLGVWRFRKMLS